MIKRNTNGRKNYRKKNPVAKPKKPARYVVADTAYKAWKTAMYVKNLINVEKKHYDFTQSGGRDWNGTITIINNPAQGLTDSMRVGDSILNKSLNISGVVSYGGSTAIARVMIIWDKQNKITLPIDALEVVGNQFAVFSPKRKDNKREFRVLYDRLFTVDSQKLQVLYNVDFKNLDTHTQFDNGTTTINSGAYKVIFISDVAAGQPNINQYRRFEYIDN